MLSILVFLMETSGAAVSMACTFDAGLRWSDSCGLIEDGGKLAGAGGSRPRFSAAPPALGRCLRTRPSPSGLG